MKRIGLSIYAALLLMVACISVACTAQEPAEITETEFAVEKKDEEPPSCPLPGSCSGYDIIVNGGDEPYGGGTGGGGGGGKGPPLNPPIKPGVHYCTGCDCHGNAAECRSCQTRCELEIYSCFESKAVCSSMISKCRDACRAEVPKNAYCECPK